jgi:pantoate--beta-alanine ligase
MEVVATKEAVRRWSAAARSDGARTALVPTMGYLHAGHLSLIELARRNAERVAVSVFVNPLQFGPGEDLDRYPRDLDRDVGLARDAGADLVFAPTAREMYPDGEPWIAVVPERGADVLCGASRPGHFRGVLTVVAKLFGLFRPDVAVFGRKDFQQLALIRRMVADLDVPVEIVAGETVREPDGLAMSSRNAYLSPSERERALALSRALAECRALLASGERDPERYRRALRGIDGEGVVVEYGEVVDARTLEPVERVEVGSVCALAARVGGTRLIDNTVLGG